MLLVKISLLLGVKVLAGVNFLKAKELREGASVRDPLGRKFYWKMELESATRGKPLLVDYSDEDLFLNILVGADGENSAVARELEFERKTLQVFK